ncbi:DNA/RNA nuclease SfsA [Acidobacteriota bacterium]
MSDSKPVPLLEVDNVQICRIVKRLNRFVVSVEIKGKTCFAHINNTGRLQEFLIEGRKAYSFKTQTGGTTDCRLFAIGESGLGALIDTQLQMKAFEKMVEVEALPWLKGFRIQKRNPRLGNSVLDYHLKDGSTEIYLEVKSAVLREAHFAMYPDCPTTRGQRHVKELTQYAQKGGTTTIVFMAALPRVTAFKPYEAGDPILHDLLQEAKTKGVNIRAIGLYYNPEDSSIHLFNPDLRIDL